MNQPTGDAAVILADLIAERGGRPAFNAVGLAAARALVQILVAAEPRSLAAIAALNDLMPPCMPTPKDNYDLVRLTDRELGHLDYLLGRANGEVPERPPRKKRTAREIEAATLAGTIDRITSQNRKATEDEGRDIRSSILRLLWPAAIPSDLWRPSVPAPAPPVVVPAQEIRSNALTEPLAGTTAENVVQMVRSIHDGAPLARHEAWRD